MRVSSASVVHLKLPTFLAATALQRKLICRFALASGDFTETAPPSRTTAAGRCPPMIRLLSCQISLSLSVNDLKRSTSGTEVSGRSAFALRASGPITPLQQERG